MTAPIYRRAPHIWSFVRQLVRTTGWHIRLPQPYAASSTVAANVVTDKFNAIVVKCQSCVDARLDASGFSLALGMWSGAVVCPAS